MDAKTSQMTNIGRENASVLWVSSQKDRNRRRYVRDRVKKVWYNDPETGRAAHASAGSGHIFGRCMELELKLRHGKLKAVVETMGGELVSLTDAAGTEYIWYGDARYWAGRNPVLFPIVGRLKDGAVRFDGVSYEMAQHGFGRRNEFGVAEQGEDFVVFELRESKNTLQIYPFRFTLRVRHQLLDNGFETRFEVSNTGETPMPFCIGAHTAFNCPMQAGLKFEDYRLVFDRQEDCSAMVPTKQGCLSRACTEYVLPGTDTIPLDHRIFDRVDTLIFEGLNSTGVSLLDPKGHGVHMAYEDFPMIAFWTKPGSDAPYLCLEPWHGCGAFEDESGEFTDKPHCIVLEPGCTKVLHYTVTLV